VQLHVVDSVTVPLLDMQIAPVSSSLIRFLVSFGRVREAALCLGRPYQLRGKVVKGLGRGRKLGVPTANLESSGTLVPGDGVYAGRCTIDGRNYAAAVSIGTMPTFTENIRQVEAHLLDFDGDLYGREISVDLIDWLRDQKRFIGAEQLVAQIGRDIEETRRIA
jgi:riboflavin kinase/FMN adenylyltransferase